MAAARRLPASSSGFGSGAGAGAGAGAAGAAGSAYASGATGPFGDVPWEEAGHAYVIRGIYDTAEEAEEWCKVPSFETKEEAEAFTKAQISKTCTNPKYPQCHHVFTTLCDWEQISTMLLPKIEEYRRRFPVRPPGPFDKSKNPFAQHKGIVKNVRLRADLPFHRVTSEESTLNTLRYMFFHMRCGIFVMIRQGRVVMFVPFVNHFYTNTFAKHMTFQYGTQSEYYRQKQMGGYRRERILPLSKWWANGNIICNEEPRDFLGDTFLPQLKEMLQVCCERRDVPDCEFFLNKRDFPHLKANLTEPYDFLFPHDDEPLPREKYESYAPIMSFFVAKSFADYPWPNTDDWETAVGMVYPPKCVDLRCKAKRKQFHVEWADKVATAVFRGNSTGGGVTPETNQRLHLASLSQDWEKDARYKHGNSVDGVRFLDAGVVNWNIRDKKIQGEPMTFLHVKEMKQRLGLAKRIPMFEQAKYKYLIYVEGHCAAARYASLMAFGSVIIKVESLTKAADMWYFPLLTSFDVSQAEMNPNADHISVKSDLSDLAEALTWLKQNDDKAQLLVKNANKLAAKYLHLDGILNYMHMCLHGVAKRFHSNFGYRVEEGEIVKGLRDKAAWEDTEGAGAGADGAAGRKKKRRRIRRPKIAPDVFDDWFGLDNVSYAEKQVPGRPAPVIPELASQCSCIRCEKMELVKPAKKGKKRTSDVVVARVKRGKVKSRFKLTAAARKAMAARAAATAAKRR